MTNTPIPPRDVREWEKSAIVEAERRGLPELRPLFESLAQSLAILRTADWNADAGSENGPRPY